MRKMMLASALAVATVAGTMPEQADARRHYSKHYRGNAYKCTRNSGTTGAIVGGAAGGLLGNALIGGTAGTLVGVAGGALGGRALTRGKVRCRYR